MAVPEEIEKQPVTETQSFTPNLEDQRLVDVKTEESNALSEWDKTYDGMIANSDKFYSDQIDETKRWGEEQAKIQQEQNDFVVEKIEQQKEEAQKDYEKEQSGAYVDWQKQSNAYGIEAEKRASNGLSNTGYSESSQVAMYNAYQNRVSVARETLNTAMLNYDNAIKDAMLQNNAALAEIAHTTFQQTLQLAMEGFHYNNDLVIQKANQKFQTQQHYDNVYLSVLDQIYNEMAMEEDTRQFNESMGLQREQFEYGKSQDSKNEALNLILSGVGNEQIYEAAGLSFEVGEALKNSIVTEREQLDINAANQTNAQERDDAITLLSLAQMGIKVPLTDSLKNMGITQSMLDEIINMGSTSSVSSGGGSGSSSGSGYSNAYLKQLYEDGDYDSFFSGLAEKYGDDEESIIAGAQNLGFSEHEIQYLNSGTITSLDQARWLLKNYGVEDYSDEQVARILSGAYTEDEFYGSGHQLSSYDSYEDYLTGIFKKYIADEKVYKNYTAPEYKLEAPEVKIRN